MAKQLDVEAFSQRKTTLSYPNVFLGEVNVSTAIVLQPRDTYSCRAHVIEYQ